MGNFTDILGSFSKQILIVSNIFILIAAIALIALPSVVKSHNGGIDLKGVCTFAIVLGVLLGAVALFGCWGVIKENPCMLTGYAVILFIIFIVQIVLAVLAFASVSDTELQFQDKMRATLEDIYNDYASNSDDIESLQKNLGCCGVTGHPEYLVPQVSPLQTCCPPAMTDMCTLAEKFKTTCDVKLADYLRPHVRAIGGVAVAFLIIELLIAIFAFYVRRMDRAY